MLKGSRSSPVRATISGHRIFWRESGTYQLLQFFLVLWVLWLLNLVGKNLNLHETETRERKWKEKRKEEGRKEGNYLGLSLLSTKSQTSCLYLFILWVTKRRKRGGGRGGRRWKEEGRVGRKLGDEYYLLFKQEETKVKRKCLAQGSRVIRRRTRTESQLCVTTKLGLPQDITIPGSESTLSPKW